MKTLKKAVSLTLALVLLLAVSLTARAVDISSYQYISLSKEPLDMVSIVGVTPAIAGNPEVPVSEIAYLVPDDATLSISLPEGGTYFVGMAMLDFPAGSGDPGYDQPLVNAPLSSDGRYTYIVYDSQGSVMEEFNFITQSYADQLTAQGFSITSTSDGPVDPPPQTEAVFADVPLDAYYAGAVAWAVEKGITNGTGATTFSPDTTCTRAEIITFLWRAAGAPAPEQSSPFTDVDANAYYAQAAAWAAENGMAHGSTFSPDDPCTRIMAVEFMWKHAGSPSGPPRPALPTPPLRRWTGRWSWASPTAPAAPPSPPRGSAPGPRLPPSCSGPLGSSRGLSGRHRPPQRAKKTRRPPCLFCV